jgi:hypothetical protein
MTRRHVLALVVAAAVSSRLRPWAVEQLAAHMIDRLTARPWLPSTAIGPFRLGRYAVALAPTADTTDTMGATQ